MLTSAALFKVVRRCLPFFKPKNRIPLELGACPCIHLYTCVLFNGICSFEYGLQLCKHKKKLFFPFRSLIISVFGARRSQVLCGANGKVLDVKQHSWSVRGIEDGVDEPGNRPTAVG